MSNCDQNSTVLGNKFHKIQDKVLYCKRCLVTLLPVSTTLDQDGKLTNYARGLREAFDII